MISPRLTCRLVFGVLKFIVLVSSPNMLEIKMEDASGMGMRVVITKL